MLVHEAHRAKRSAVVVGEATSVEHLHDLALPLGAAGRGTRIVVLALRLVGLEGAAPCRIAAVGRAALVIPADPRQTDADALGAAVVDSARVAVVALPFDRDEHAASGRVAAVGRAGPFVDAGAGEAHAVSTNAAVVGSAGVTVVTDFAFVVGHHQARAGEGLAGAALAAGQGHVADHDRRRVEHAALHVEVAPVVAVAKILVVEALTLGVGGAGALHAILVTPALAFDTSIVQRAGILVVAVGSLLLRRVHAAAIGLAEVIGAGVVVSARARSPPAGASDAAVPACARIVVVTRAFLPRRVGARAVAVAGGALSKLARPRGVAHVGRADAATVVLAPVRAGTGILVVTLLAHHHRVLAGPVSVADRAFRPLAGPGLVAHVGRPEAGSVQAAVVFRGAQVVVVARRVDGDRVAAGAVTEACRAVRVLAGTGGVTGVGSAPTAPVGLAAVVARTGRSVIAAGADLRRVLAAPVTQADGVFGGLAWARLVAWIRHASTGLVRLAAVGVGAGFGIIATPAHSGPIGAGPVSVADGVVC